jgi:hypothetical protein
MEAYNGSRGLAPLILNLGTIPAMLYTIPMQKCYKQAVTQAIIPTVSLLWSWMEIVYGKTHTHTHTKVSALWPPKHEKGIPLTKTAAAYRRQNDDHAFLVCTTANTLNVSVRHLTAGLCECRRLQNTDRHWHSGTVLCCLSVTWHT